MFKFSLRDLFWLILVVAMGCGWWLEAAQNGVLQIELNAANDRVLKWKQWLENRGLDRYLTTADTE